MNKLQNLRALIQKDIESLQEEITMREQVKSPSGGVRGLASLNRLRGRKEGLEMAQQLILEVFFSEWKTQEPSC